MHCLAHKGAGVGVDKAPLAMRRWKARENVDTRPHVVPSKITLHSERSSGFTQFAPLYYYYYCSLYKRIERFARPVTVDNEVYV
jgi:hypothetical protein